MDADEAIRPSQRIDPIWRRLRILRICKYSWIGLWLVLMTLLFISLLQNGKGNQSWVIFIYPLAILPTTFLFIRNQVMQERYWKRVGQRRSEALREPDRFHASRQPEMTDRALPSLPIHIQLAWKRRYLAVILGLPLLFLVLLLGIGSILTLEHSFRLDSFLAIGVSITPIILGTVALTYLLFVRYQPRSIEVTEDGISTSYMQQRSSIRWEEARIFAHIDAMGLTPNVAGLTFELANGHTIVRWSQQRVGDNAFTMTSNVPGEQNYNRLIDDINSIVAQTSGLPLLELGDHPRIGLRGANGQPTQQEVRERLAQLRAEREK